MLSRKGNGRWYLHKSRDALRLVEMHCRYQGVIIRAMYETYLLK